MAAGHTCISEERLEALLMTEEFKKQKRSILNIISSNFEISMNEIKNLKLEISEIKSSLDVLLLKEDVLQKKVEKLEENMKDVDASIRDIDEYQVNPNYVLDKLAELEDRARRNNLPVCMESTRGKVKP